VTGSAPNPRRATRNSITSRYCRCAPRPFPASARRRRRVSETSEGAGPKTRPPQLPSWDGRRPRAETHDQAAYFHSPSENSRTASESKGLVPEVPRRTLMASTYRTGSELLSAGSTFVCSTTANGARPKPHCPVPNRTTTRSVQLL
jgi:hypothetical protein